MKHLPQKIMLGCLGVLMLGLMVGPPASASPVSQFAQGNPGCARGLLTLPVWYRGLTSGGNCELNIGDNPNFIWVIALNVVEMFMHVVGYVSGIFVLVGGFRYMTSTGEPDKISGAKKTISSAVTGLIIALFSVAIINFIIGQVT